MSDHAWVQEQIATAVADGLTAEETERLDNHVRACPECATALAEARKLGGKLGSLFAPARPALDLEDRVIQTLRTAETRRRLLSGWRRKLAVGIAASVGIGLTGAAVDQYSGLDLIRLFDNSGSMSSVQVQREAPATHIGRPHSTVNILDDDVRARRSDAQANAVTMADDLSKRLLDEFSAHMDYDSGSENHKVDNARGEHGSAPKYGAYNGGLFINLEPFLDTPSVADTKATILGGIPASTGIPTVSPNQVRSFTTPAAGPNASSVDHSWDYRSYVTAPSGDAKNIKDTSFGALDQGKEGNGRSLGYIKPSDLKPAPSSLTNLAGGEATGIQTAPGYPEQKIAALSSPSAGAEKSDKANLESRVAAMEESMRRVPGSVSKDDYEGAKLAAKRHQEEEIAKKSSGGRDASVGEKERQVREQKDFLLELPASSPAEGQRQTAPAPAHSRKIIIRSGDMEFQIESFDSAVATVTRLVTGIDGAFVDTVNSEKLPNGKVKGSIVLRVPPERLDALVLDLRKELGKGGELKGQRIGSQDITKQYTDLESRLRAARTMESRLLQMIKEGKGEIKQLLEAEKELGVWRTKIEECEGELRYYGNLVALSTLTITLEEKGIRAAAAMTECERVQAGIEVEDVDQALQQAQAAVAEAKGRVTKSELKQLAAGQFNATLNCELAPAAAGPFRDRLNQLGRVARLEIDRVQQSEGGTAVRDARLTRGDTQFLVQFYNLANVAPRESTALLLAVADVPAGYQSLREAVGKAHGRVITSQLNEQDRQNVSAQIDFEVRRPEEAALLTALTAAGEVVSRNVTRAADGDNLTDAKVLFRTTLVSAAHVKPRETTVLALEVPDVDAAAAVMGAQVQEAKGRTVDTKAAHERAGRVTARIVYDVPLAAAAAVVEKLKSDGIVRVQQSSRDLQAPDGRLAMARLEVTLSNTDLIVAKDDGLWPQMRRGLSLSATVLLMSVTWVIFGLCVVLPWAAVGYGGYRLFRRLVPRPVATSPPPATTG